MLQKGTLNIIKYNLPYLALKTVDFESFRKRNGLITSDVKRENSLGDAAR